MYTNSYKTCFTRQFYLRARTSDFAQYKPIGRSCRVSVWTRYANSSSTCAVQTGLLLDKPYGKSTTC